MNIKKPPTTIAEHLRIVKEKENNARIYDDCKFCHALDEEQSYLFWFDCLNAAMRLYKIHKNILKVMVFRIWCFPGSYRDETRPPNFLVTM